MASDGEPLERAYPYRAGFKAMGCAFLVFGTIGAGGLSLIPLGCGQVRGGNAPLGALICLGAALTAPMALLAVGALVVGVRDTFAPPVLKVTPGAVRLPHDLRGAYLNKTADGEPDTSGPRTHPEEVPFAAIRWARREAGTGPGNDRLLIVHTLGTATLELHQSMMRAADLDELETILRAAVPEAFVALPVPQEPPRPEGPTDAF